VKQRVAPDPQQTTHNIGATVLTCDVQACQAFLRRCVKQPGPRQSRSDVKVAVLTRDVQAGKAAPRRDVQQDWIAYCEQLLHYLNVALLACDVEARAAFLGGPAQQSHVAEPSKLYCDFQLPVLSSEIHA
jgi:hypothetical protein